jgi:hypothetical protein
MHTRSDLKGEAFLSCCADFKKLANDYLVSQSNKTSKFIPSFFIPRPVVKKVADSLLESVRKVTFSIDYPDIRFSKRVSFLEECAGFFKKLTEAYHSLCNNKQINDDLWNFRRQFSQMLKRLTYLTISGEVESCHSINLNYLDYYLDQIATGDDCYSNDVLLKHEISDLLSQHIEYYPNSDVTKIIIPLLDAINDSQGVNQHSHTEKEKFDNLLNFITTFLSCLNEKNEKDLHYKISRIVDRALDVDANFSTDFARYQQKINSSVDLELVGLVKLR